MNDFHSLADLIDEKPPYVPECPKCGVKFKTFTDEVHHAIWHLSQLEHPAYCSHCGQSAKQVSRRPVYDETSGDLRGYWRRFRCANRHCWYYWTRLPILKLEVL